MDNLRNVTIHDNVVIGNNVKIGLNSIVYPNVTIDDDTIIGSNCIIGEPTIDYYSSKDSYNFKPVHISNNSIIRSNTVIYEDVNIGNNFQTGHNATIHEKTKIGRNCSVGTSSEIMKSTSIGNYVRIHSNVFIGEESIIEDYVWLFPKVTLTNDTYPPMNNLKPVTVKKFAQLAANVIVLPGKIIGENSLVGAGSLVTTNVDKNSLYFGSPATRKCSIEEIRNEDGEQIYPWKDFLKENRGYPWQEK